jgi:hypothetical protein
VQNLVVGSENTPVNHKLFRPTTNSNFAIMLYRNGALSPTVSLYLVLYLCMHACVSFCISPSDLRKSDTCVLLIHATTKMWASHQAAAGARVGGLQTDKKLWRMKDGLVVSTTIFFHCPPTLGTGNELESSGEPTSFPNPLQVFLAIIPFLQGHIS